MTKTKIGLQDRGVVIFMNLIDQESIYLRMLSYLLQQQKRLVRNVNFI